MTKYDKEQLVALILGLGLFFAFLIGLYIYQGGPAEDADKWVPLFQSMIPVGIMVGFPIIITLVIVFVVVVLMTGAKIAKQVVVGKADEEEDVEEKERIKVPVSVQNFSEINRRHSRRK